MIAVQLTGHGEIDRLVIANDVPVPSPRTDEVLIAVGASSVNNTDINTRIGWYTRKESARRDIVVGNAVALSADSRSGLLRAHRGGGRER